MAASPPRRSPWWKKKRWAAALTLWLALAYPLSIGPVAYCAKRGWISGPSVEPIYDPLDRLLYAADQAPEVIRSWINAHTEWWADLGDRHTTPD